MHRDSLHSSVVGRNLLQTGSSADVVPCLCRLHWRHRPDRRHGWVHGLTRPDVFCSSECLLAHALAAHLLSLCCV